MTRDKIYLPTENGISELMGMTETTNGFLVYPPEGSKTGRHVTVLLKKVCENKFMLEIHTTTESNENHKRFYRKVIGRNSIVRFLECLLSVQTDIITSVKKSAEPRKSIEKHNLTCMECLATNNQLPTNRTGAQDFWNRFQTNPNEVKPSYCNNSNHRLFFDPIRKEIALFKDSRIQLYFSPQMFNEFEKVFDKHLPNFFDSAEDFFLKLQEALSEVGINAS